MLLQVDRKFYMDARKANGIKKERLEMRNLKNVIEYKCNRVCNRVEIYKQERRKEKVTE